jgi:putative transposase
MTSSTVPQRGAQPGDGRSGERRSQVLPAGSAAPQCGAQPGDSDGDGVDDGRSRERRSHKRSHKGWYSRGYLPHYDAPNVIQHITYHLADSMAQAVLAEMRTELKTAVRDEKQRDIELRRRIEAYLDAGYGSCILREPAVAACIVNTWFHFDGDRYRLLEWVVMPNHCHVLIEQLEGFPLWKIVLSWKNYTARFINEYKRRMSRMESRTGVRRSGDGEGQVWQRDYWDRFIRNERHLQVVREYIVMNPVKAGLVAAPEDWPWSSAVWRGKYEG